MYRDKTIIRCRKIKEIMRYPWHIKIGNRIIPEAGISRMLRLVSKLIEDKAKVYSIDIIIKRRK